LLSATLLTTLLLLAGLLLSALLLLAGLLLSALLLLARLLVRVLILIHHFLQRWFPKRHSIRAPWQKIMREPPNCSRTVPFQLSKKRIWNSTPSDVFHLTTRGIDDGTLSAAVAARGANSSSAADLDFWRFALVDAGSRPEPSSVAEEKYTVCNVPRACFRQRRGLALVEQLHLVTPPSVRRCRSPHALLSL
jgi:hypothetical protein